MDETTAATIGRSAADDVRSACSGELGGTEAGWWTVNEALCRWGKREQMMMAAGEIGEFLTCFGRIVQGRYDEGEFASEIADVMIMMRSMALIAGPERVAEEMERKLWRLRAKLDASAA